MTDQQQQPEDLETAAIEIVGKDVATEEKIRAVVLNQYEDPRENIMEEERNELVRRTDAEQTIQEASNTAYQAGKKDRQEHTLKLIEERIQEQERHVEKYSALDQVNLNDAKARRQELESLRSQLRQEKASTEKKNAEVND